MIANLISRFPFARTPAIGFDLAPEKLHMAQMRDAGNGPAIHAAVSVSYPDDRESLLGDPPRLKAFIKRAFHGQPFLGRRVVTALPPGDLKIMPVSYQAAHGQNEQDSVLKELRERLRDELEQSIIDYMPIRTGEPDGAAKDVLVAVAKRERVVTYLDHLSRAGLEPVALDIGPAALCRLVSAMREQPPYRNVLLINFGSDKSYLTVVWGKRLMLDREIEFGEKQLLARLAKRLNMDAGLALNLLRQRGFARAEAATPARTHSDIALTEILRADLSGLVEEVHKTLVYTASKTRGNSVDQIYLLGSLARYPHIAKWMQNSLSIPVEVLNPLKAFSGRMTEPEATGMALAVGLALRGVKSCTT